MVNFSVKFDDLVVNLHQDEVADVGGVEVVGVGAQHPNSLHVRLHPILLQHEVVALLWRVTSCRQRSNRLQRLVLWLLPISLLFLVVLS